MTAVKYVDGIFLKNIAGGEQTVTYQRRNDVSEDQGTILSFVMNLYS